MKKSIILATALAATILCGAVGSVAVAAKSSRTQTSTTGAAKRLAAKQKRGLTFATAHCTACHGIAPGTISPNPESPPFEAIANTSGLTVRTLSEFLRDHHNFPDAMAFEIAPAQVSDLAAYMVTLKRADYQPEIQ